MKVYIVVLLALVALAASADVHKRLNLRECLLSTADVLMRQSYLISLSLCPSLYVALSINLLRNYE